MLSSPTSQIIKAKAQTYKHIGSIKAQTCDHNDLVEI